MKNKTIFYSLTAILWISVAFFIFFISIKDKGNLSKQTLYKSSKKIEALHQQLFELEDLWWKRNKVRYINDISYPKDIEILQATQKAKDMSKTLMYKKMLTFQEAKSFLPSFEQDTLLLDLYALSLNESYYNSSSLYSLMYRNKIYQQVREYWFEQRTRSIYEPCFAFNKLTLHIFEDRKGIYRLGFIEKEYSEIPIIINILMLNQRRDKRDFDFKVSIEYLGRNPKTTTKKYKTTPKEGQELKPFDYEEIE